MPNDTSDEALVELADLIELYRRGVKEWEARQGVKTDSTEAP